MKWSDSIETMDADLRETGDRMAPDEWLTKFAYPSRTKTLRPTKSAAVAAPNPTQFNDKLPNLRLG